MTDVKDALKRAREEVNTLYEAARTGQIIPIRLPGQIEAIAQLLEQAEREQAEALAEASANAMPADVAATMQEEAYFVGHAVHELRTPMTSIRGYGDMLGAMGELNDMQKQFLDVIKTNSRRMESLLSDVSFINKIRKGTLKLSAKMDLFKNIALKVEKDMKPLAEQFGREWVVDIPSGLPLLNIDGDMLALALNKLVENSLRYGPKENGRVSLGASAEGNTLVIHLEDNGIGISPEDMAQLGKIYFRSDDDVVREHKGSGLGIPIAYGLLDLLGASVSLQSTLGEGTRFEIRVEGMS